MSTTPPAYFTPGLNDEERLRLLRARASALGYTVREWEHPTRSMTNPVTREICLRRGSLSARADDLLPLLAHEVRHGEQQAGHFLHRAAWGFCYLADALGAALLLGATLAALWSLWSLLAAAPALGLLWLGQSFRSRVEAEGEAHEAAMRAVLTRELYAEHKLGGFRAPYFLVGNSRDRSASIVVLARALLPGSW